MTSFNNKIHIKILNYHIKIYKIGQEMFKSKSQIHKKCKMTKGQ